MGKIVQEAGTRLYPVPAVLVSCGKGDEANIITLAWVGTVCSRPPMVAIGVRPHRYSHGLVEEQGEFVVNLPRADQVEWVDYCGVVSGEVEDKWEACGFTQVPASEVEVPLIAECPVNIECRVRETLSLGAHDLFIGEVVAIQVDEDMADERGRFDIEALQPFAYAGGEYWSLGDKIGEHGFTAKRD